MEGTGRETTKKIFSITINCPTCNESFTPNTSRQRFCSHRCNRNVQRSARRKAHDLTFIGVDGEGVNLRYLDGSKRHVYIMLSVGDETLFEGGRELTHNDIFPFLYNEFSRNPHAAYVGFYLGYDFALWLKSLPVDRARMLFNPDLRKRRSRTHNPVPFPVYVGDWEFDLLGMKRFKLRPRNVGTKNNAPWLYVCDTGSFYQTSFVNVINPDPEKWPTGAPCTDEEYQTIVEGKTNRANEIDAGDTSYYHDMAKYNQLENRILARTCSILNQGFTHAGVQLKRDAFYGPGQAIQVWLNRKDKSVALSREKLAPVLPNDAIQAATASYYGGWFEPPYIGHIPGESYEYDIVSAYPHIMRGLPCLCSGQWFRGTGKPPTLSSVLVFGTFVGSNECLGAMSLRNRKGNILRPNRVRGWYLWNEVLASIRAGLINAYDIERWIGYKGCSHPPPLAELGELFLERQRVGKNTPTGKAIKLMLNSAYGKFAQSIGSPKYGNPIYATMITSQCRAIILDAIATHPYRADHVLMIATDGIYFRTPHPKLDARRGKQLGDWEKVSKHNLTIMKAGVYWDDKAREAVAKGKIAPIKSRGISAKALSDNIAAIDAAFTVMQNDITAPLPKLQINVPFSVTSPRLALARGKWETAGMVQWNVPRTDAAALEPKRSHLYQEGVYLRSHPVIVPDGTTSVPYDKTFGYTDSEEQYGYMPDGSVLDYISEIGKVNETW